ncbi:hypothetical protein BVC80_1605g14 [Macleaya cordata]|uniref:Uncharacterized protein n=1 Tax=Macleaya cordata TaxID=56857 RepID=A0A200QA34_MACCD|nr:hypothetical protein BVC80_1605g14 [Macleaya cordata]
MVGTTATTENSAAGNGSNGLAKIQTQDKKDDQDHDEICHDDSAPPVKAQTIEQLHSLQKKRSAPTTPKSNKQQGMTTQQGGALFSPISEEDRQKQQLQSIR